MRNVVQDSVTKEKETEDQNGEEIVVSGMSGRFPESDNLEEFQQNLFRGVDMITDDGRRWTPGIFGLPKRSGKLKNLDKFDAQFFSVHPKQANHMDPQLRLLLEVTHEAIIDAGVNPVEIRGSRTGVFVGSSGSESEKKWVKDKNSKHGYTLTGTTRGMFSNRVSFAFDFHGPSFCVDTACSSSFIALEQAVASIRLGHCDAAIVAGTHICLSPDMCQQFQRMNMLAADGKCRSFDASGSGYVRSEAVVAIFIQKKNVARRHYATILAASTNTDGHKAKGVTFPSGEMQQSLLEETYRRAGINPLELSYMEAHGTGTPAGDPQEVNAIANALCGDRTLENPLLIGSVKSNCGHAEPVSGLCGLVKVILAMQTSVIPANLHYEAPNPNIPALVEGRLKVVAENTPWEGGIVGVNSFGFGGANVHVILKSNPKKIPADSSSAFLLNSSPPFLIPVSGRTKEAVEFALDKIKSGITQLEISTALEQLSLLHKITRVNIPGHNYRGFTIIDKMGSVITESEIQETHTKSPRSSSIGQPVWFVFNGMGSQWVGMGRGLLKFPVCTQSLENSASILKSHNLKVELDLMDILLKCSNRETEDFNVLESFVAIASVQIALVDLLRSLNVTPDGIIGHSVGELGAAYADGCLTAEQTILAAYWRGQAILESPSPVDGAFGMAAIGMSWEEAGARCPPGIYPACHNGQDSVTISGPLGNIRQFVEVLQKEGVFAREVNSAGQAFHSKYIEPAKPLFKESLDKIIPVPSPRSSRWISSSISESQWESDLAKTCSADYHVNNMISPVLFQEALEKVPDSSIVIEIGPHSLLQAILKRSLPNCTHIGLLNKSHPDNSLLLCKNVGKMYNCGLNPSISELYPNVEFPVSISTPSLSSYCKWEHSQSWNVPDFCPDRKLKSKSLKNSSSGEIELEICLGKESEEFYRGHKIDGRILFPATGHFLLIWRAFASLQGKQFFEVPIVLERIKIYRATVFQPNYNGDPVKFSINIFKSTGEFQITEGGTLVSSGLVRAHQSKGSEFLPLDPLDMTMTTGGQQQRLPLEFDDIYKELRLRGYDYSGDFKGMVRTDPDAGWAEIQWTGNWISFMDTILQATLLNDGNRALFLPSYLEKAVFDPQTFLQSLLHISSGEEIEDGEESESEEPDVANPKSPKIVSIFHYETLKVVACEGIQFQGWKNEMASRKNQASTCSNFLRLEKLQFTPYFDKEKMRLDKETILSVCVDIVLENIGDNELNLVELLENSEHSLSLEVHSCCLGHPTKLCNATALFLNSNEPPNPNPNSAQDEEFITNLKNSEISVKFNASEEEINWKKLGISKVDLIITSDERLLKKGADIFQTAPQQTNQGFLLFHQNPVTSEQNEPVLTEPLKNVKNVDGLICVTHKISQDGTQFYLFKKSITQSQLILPSISVIEIDAPVSSSNSNSSEDLIVRNYSWVQELKVAMKKVVESTGSQSQMLSEHRIFIVSRESSEFSNPSGIIGLVNCLRKEPGGDKIRCYFIRASSSISSNLNGLNFQMPNKSLAPILQRDLVMNVFDGDGQWGSCRFFPVAQTMKRVNHAYVNVLTRGDLSSIRWFESSLKFHPKQNLCHVYYAALNFRDVMIATGKLSLDSLPNGLGFHDCTLGMEYSGIHQSGDKIMGFVGAKALATTVLPEAGATWAVPPNWTLAQAATVPVAFSTAYYALIVRGRLKPGEKVLIHSGSGGVGQAALSIALSLNCTVFTTVGSAEKQQFLHKTFPQLKTSSFANSRDTSFLEHILKQTKGRGVDLVLNSLAEEKLQASIKCLAQHGRFLEIGKVDLFKNTSLGMSVLLKNVTVHGILLDSLVEGDPEQKKIQDLVQQGIQSGVVRPLTYTSFSDSPEDIERAFRYMASGKHVGKILIQIRNPNPNPEQKDQNQTPELKTVSALPRTYFNPDQSYIILGGLGGFGLEMAAWMRERGAHKFVLVSRSGVKNGYQDLRLRKLRQDGAEIYVANNLDVTTLEGIKTLLKQSISYFNGVPIGGIFNLALVLADGLLENQTEEKFDVVCKSKVNATIALDKVSRDLAPNLEYFVCFSSLSSGRGAPGLSNYSYANSCMERICENRRTQGFPGLAIQWGAVGDVGVLQEDKGMGNDAVIGGTVPQRISNCLSTMDILLHENVSENSPVLSSHVLAIKSNGSNNNGGKNGAGNSQDSGTGNLMERVAHILGMKAADVDKVNKQTMLYELGMDSLMSVEIKQLIQISSGLSLSTAEMLELTFGKIEEIQNSSSIASAVIQETVPNDDQFDKCSLNSHVDSAITADLKSNDASISISVSVGDDADSFELISETPYKECTEPLLPNFTDNLTWNPKSEIPVKSHYNNKNNGFSLSHNGKSHSHLADIPPASSNCLYKTMRQFTLVFSYVISALFFLTMQLLYGISIFLRLFIRAQLYIFRSSSEIRLMDRRLDQTCAINPRLSNVLFTLKLGGVPKKSRIISVLEERVIHWRTDISPTGTQVETYQPYERLRWRVKTGLLFCYWEKDADFRVVNQVKFREITVGLGTESQDLEAESLRVVEQYHNHRWDEKSPRPQWEIQIISPKYSVNHPAESKEFIIVLSVHHSYGDGYSILEMLQWALCDGASKFIQQPPAPQLDKSDKKPKEKKKWRIFHSLIKWHKLLMELSRHYREVDYNFSMRCSQLDSPRFCGLAKVNLTQVKSVRNESGQLVSANTVVLTCASKAYERIFGDARRRIPHSFVSGMPFIVHPNEKLGLLNSVAGNVAEIPLCIPDSWERLGVVQRNLEECCKRDRLEIIWEWVPQLTSMINPIQAFLFSIFPSPNMIYTNVPASLPRHLTFFGGYKLKDFAGFPALFSSAHSALASSIDSVNDQVALALVVDQSPIDVSKEFIPEFFKYFQMELDHLTSPQTHLLK